MTSDAAHKQKELARDELRAIVTFARSLDRAALAAPSLCTGWRIDDVLAHLAWTATAPLGTLARAMLLGGLRPGPRMASHFGRAAVEHRQTHAIGEIIDTLNELAQGARAYGMGARIGRPREYLVDYVVHHADIRRALGKPAPVLNERTIAALDAAPTIGGLIGGKQRSRGLRLLATDTDWVRGTGPTIEGPAEMLLLGITGRPAALSELEGEGVAVLAGRIGG